MAASSTLCTYAVATDTASDDDDDGFSYHFIWDTCDFCLELEMAIYIFHKCLL